MGPSNERRPRSPRQRGSRRPAIPRTALAVHENQASVGGPWTILPLLHPCSAVITICYSVVAALALAVHPAARRLDVARVRVAEVDLGRWHIGELIGLRRTAESAAVLHHPARAVGLVIGVRAT